MVAAIPKVPALVVLICASMQACVLADRDGGEPRNTGIRRYVLGEISGDTRVEQRFHVHADGLSAVTIYPQSLQRITAGSAVVVLRDLKSGIVRQQEIPLSELAASEALTLRFLPQPSRERDYSLEFRVTGTSRDRGIGLLASRGQGARWMALTINGSRPRWGNLVFSTTVDRATTNFGAIAGQLARTGMPAAGAVLVLLLVAVNAAVFFIIDAFMPSNVPGAVTQEHPAA